MLKYDYRPEGNSREKSEDKKGIHDVFRDDVYFVLLHRIQIIAYRSSMRREFKERGSPDAFFIRKIF